MRSTRGGERGRLTKHAERAFSATTDFSRKFNIQVQSGLLPYYVKFQHIPCFKPFLSASQVLGCFFFFPVSPHAKKKQDEVLTRQLFSNLTDFGGYIINHFLLVAKLSSVPIL